MKLFNHDKCKEEKQEVLKTFENTILKVLESVEKTNNKFYEMAAKIQMEHFKQLEKHSAKLMGSLEKNTEDFIDLLKKPEPMEPVVQRLSDIELPVENAIEKEDIESPFEEMDKIPIEQGIKVQFEGEEEIFEPNIVS